MTLILMTNPSIKAYTDNYIWLIVTNEDNLLLTYREPQPIQRI
jgi:hypothetical protein